MKKKMIIVLVVMMMLGIVACGGNSGSQQTIKQQATQQQNTLVGRWELVTDSTSSYFYTSKKFELFSDGTGISSAGYQERWIAENGRLKIGDYVYSYKISGNKLTLTHDDGTIETYQRVQQ